MNEKDFMNETIYNKMINKNSGMVASFTDEELRMYVQLLAMMRQVTKNKPKEVKVPSSSHGKLVRTR